MDVATRLHQETPVSITARNYSRTAADPVVCLFLLKTIYALINSTSLQCEGHTPPTLEELRNQPSPFLSVANFVRLYNFGKEVCDFWRFMFRFCTMPT